MYIQINAHTHAIKIDGKKETENMKEHKEGHTSAETSQLRVYRAWLFLFCFEGFSE